MIDTKWDNRFMRLAREVSTWSKDPSSKIGAVVVDLDRRVLCMGYNGFPKGIADDERLQDRPRKYEHIIHAEMNVIYNAAKLGIDMRGTTLYIYGLPMCSVCALGAIQTEFYRVVMHVPGEFSTQWAESWKKTEALLDEAKISWAFIPLY